MHSSTAERDLARACSCTDSTPTRKASFVSRTMVSALTCATWNRSRLNFLVDLVVGLSLGKRNDIGGRCGVRVPRLQRPRVRPQPAHHAIMLAITGLGPSGTFNAN